MKKINYGHINGTTYIKEIDFNKAVIWKSKEISIHSKVVLEWFPAVGVTDILFTDHLHEKKYSVTVAEASKHWHYDMVGQEKQFYFPIGILKVEEIKNG